MAEEEILERCCGLDIHRQTVVACRITPAADGKPERAVRTFGTTTRAILELRAWLEEGGCTHVAMESTGSYWKPLYNLLEDHFELVVVNSQHLKLLPRRKSDVRDAEHIAQLLRKRMLRGSAIPNRAERELRELDRYRTSLVRERTAEINRVHKVLEGANIKLGTVASDIVGVSGWTMLEEMVAGVTTAEALAQHARGKLKDKAAALVEALVGSVGAHQRFVLRQQLRHIRELDALIVEVENELDERTRPFAETIERLDTLPGFGRRTAITFLVEMGTDLRHFGSADEAVSWAGLCPGSHESAGKNRSGRTPKGSRSLRACLTQAAHAAGKTATAVGERHRRLRGRLDARKAAIATAHQLALIAFHVVRDQTTYRDELIRRPDPAVLARQYVRRLENLGYTVTLAA